MAADARLLAGAALAEALRDARATTLARTLDRVDAAWRVPMQAGVNPLAWELGHLAWFAEFWILRGPHRLDPDGFVSAARPALIAGPDAIFDSARLAHDERWRVALPSRAALAARLATQLDACIEAIPRDETDDAAHYFHRLALFHEDMHGEAFAWLRATLGWPAPPGLAALPSLPTPEPLRLAGGTIALGRATDERGFAFDNEQPATTVRVAPFEIDATPIRNAELLRFVAAGGYDDAAFWPGAAGAWRARQPLGHPQRWRREGEGAWQMRWFDRWQPLDPAAPVVHVSAWEAEAYCRWAGRRLPRAAEWEFAARDPRFAWGKSVWEWSADAFLPYPRFVAGPYVDYSRPWFGDHRELRGGAFATPERLHDPRYRNFFVADRNDVFAGFRTAALQR
ncbi:MAG TPA: selenoneine synthase SenA [Caldimonas sp.]|jgi:ergothioneine biosynthesis protein EgtB|nr:selenoneine synthase SenA [Caldimonas sp.]HEV7576545.1 selenoneine synthase SenA [Caldimonas sp.]